MKASASWAGIMMLTRPGTKPAVREGPREFMIATEAFHARRDRHAGRVSARSSTARLGHRHRLDLSKEHRQSSSGLRPAVLAFGLLAGCLAQSAAEPRLLGQLDQG